ncbi:TniB family NTP-binding protein [Roseateles sp. DB2]|uniref:TniB family NTP-binding protein n=1 Tax=Roseateles sp. DB2 TaxID=3453717 RepID=UPI003EEB4765
MAESVIRRRRHQCYSEHAIEISDALDRRYVLFPAARDILGALDRSYQLARRPHRPQGFVVVGPPGTSKTTLAQYFQGTIQPRADVADGYGVLSFRLRANPCASSMVSAILRAIRHPFTKVSASKMPSMRDIAFEAIKDRGCRMLIVDQAHGLARHATSQGRNGQIAIETTASEVLRDLVDETGIAVVLLVNEGFVGLEAIDRALADRIPGRLRLDYFSNDATWRHFLTELTRDFKQIDLSIVSGEGVPESLHAATGGNRRRIKLLLTEAVLVAVDADSKSVEKDHLKLAFDRAFGTASGCANPYVGG